MLNQNEIDTFKSVAHSAQETWGICYRQSLKDSRKLYRGAQVAYSVLTSEEAVKTYRTVYNAVMVAVTLAIALGGETRKRLDALVEESLATPDAEETREPVVNPGNLGFQIVRKQMRPRTQENFLERLDYEGIEWEDVTEEASDDALDPWDA